MRIGEIIERSGLSKKAIHYYMQERLISPQQENNGYFIFTDDDLQRLQVIQKMRYMGFSIEKIRSVLAEPTLAFYYFIKQKKELLKESERLAWMSSMISKVAENLSTDTTFETLAQDLTVIVREYPDDPASKPIDDNDAELLAYFFWGRFVGKSDLTEYQKYLWEKMKKTIVLTQTPSTRELRDAVYHFQANHIDQEFINPAHNEVRRDEIASLSEKDYPAYVNRLIDSAWEHLKDPIWIKSWKKLQTYTINAGIFFDSEASALMCELSPVFKHYQTNINQCGEILGTYLQSEPGEDLLALIYSTLSEDLDLYSHHHATLIGICC